MDAHHFDHLARALAAAGNRRSLVRGLAALPVMGGVLAYVADQGELAAKGRRKKKRKKKGGQGKKGGKPQAACPPCPTGQQCVRGACVTGCAPACDGKACGASDGCGGTCQTGSCAQCQTCQAGECVAAADGAACDPGNFCVFDASCQSGECTVQSEAQCFPPDNVCLTASCNPESGNCENSPRAAGYPCDTSEVCMFKHGGCDGNGACASTPIVCQRPGEHCCPSGEFQGECRRKDGEQCGGNSSCCSNNCFLGLYCM